ncbi:MAG: PQQ-dependent sugar dehydrogenase [Chloroflexota bacterium]|nr:PQQ-dependent sugar dehydrogenase [Chloroflexota bacterium]
MYDSPFSTKLGLACRVLPLTVICLLLVAGCGSGRVDVSTTSGGSVDAVPQRSPTAPSLGSTPGATLPQSLTNHGQASGAADPGATLPQPLTNHGQASGAADPSFGLALKQVAGGFHEPVFVTHAGDGSDRLFIVEKAGTIRTAPDVPPFLDVRDRVLAQGPEQGLLGLAFHPRFRSTRFFYVSYTDASGGLVVSRFRATPDGSAADPHSENVLFWQPQPASNHNGGMLAFGPDHFLYIGLGDGGGANDEFQNAQNRQTLLGALLRIDVDHGDPYAIPADNPFVDDASALSEIWAYGLRNPWRFSFDRLTADLYLADVGQNLLEGVYLTTVRQARGINYGWPFWEGSHCVDDRACYGINPLRPVAEYDHSQGCAITGGYVYRGAQLPVLYGTYVFGDYCTGRIWTLTAGQPGQWRMHEALRTTALISSFGEDELGELYVTDIGAGTLYRIGMQSP